MFRSPSPSPTFDEGDPLPKSRFLAPLLAILSIILSAIEPSATELLAILTLISSTGVNMFSSPSPVPTLDEGDQLPKSRFLVLLLAILSAILLLAIRSAISPLAILTPHGRLYARFGFNESESDLLKVVKVIRMAKPVVASTKVIRWANGRSGYHAPLAKPCRVFRQAILLLAIPHGRFYSTQSNQGESSGSGGIRGGLFPVINMDRSKGCEPDGEISFLNDILFDGGSPLPVPNSYGMRIWSDDPMVLLAENSYVSYLLAIPCEGLYAKRSNQGESSGSGGRAREERNGGGGDGNQGIRGGVGGGGHREGSGNERRGSRGRGHGGGNGDDDDNDRRGWVGYIEDERRPMGPRPDRMAEILLPLNFQIFATVESLDITELSVRVRIVRVVSLAFTAVALVCLSTSIRQRGTNPRLASILSWIGSVATFLGFILMIDMALLASLIP